MSQRYTAARHADCENWDTIADTWWDAMLEFAEVFDHEAYDQDAPTESTPVAVAIARKPDAPWKVAVNDGDQVRRFILEQTEGAEDYMIDAAEDFLERLTLDQLDDLRDVVRAAIESWFKRHKLEPCWFICEHVRTIALSWAYLAEGLAETLDGLGYQRFAFDQARFLTPDQAQLLVESLRTGKAVDLHTLNVWEAAAHAQILDRLLSECPKLP